MGALTLTTLLLGSLILGLGVDVHINDGQFAKSFTGKTLKQYGGFEYGQLLYEEAILASNKTAQWAIANVPLYLNSTSEYLRPYVRLGRDLSLTTYNIAKSIIYNIKLVLDEKYPTAEKWVLENLPIVKKNWNLAVDAILHGATVTFDVVKTQGANAAQFLRKNVFVGSLSPENLQKYTMEAYNTTQVYAANTISWVYGKVRTLSD